MRARPLSFVLLAVALAAALLGVGTAAADPDRTTYRSFAGMNGQKEVPGPGDQGASGRARVTANPTTGEVCWKLVVRNIDGTVTAAHIHVGDRDEAGPIVQTLSTPVNGTSSGCAVNDPLAENLADDPSEYYVNVHSSAHGDGAVRGQLAGQHR